MKKLAQKQAELGKKQTSSNNFEKTKAPLSEREKEILNSPDCDWFSPTSQQQKKSPKQTSEEQKHTSPEIKTNNTSDLSNVSENIKINSSTTLLNEKPSEKEERVGGGVEAMLRLCISFYPFFYSLTTDDRNYGVFVAAMWIIFMGPFFVMFWNAPTRYKAPFDSVMAKTGKGVGMFFLGLIAFSGLLHVLFGQGRY